MKSAIRVLVTVAVALLATWTALAGGNRKIMVLPINGDADQATRTQITQAVVKVARQSSGVTVTTGTTTFAETAAAVGCDPATTTCSDSVIGTLGVDEVVFGTATTSGGQTTISVTRLGKGGLRKDQTVTVEGADKAEGALRPLYGGTATTGSGGTPGSATEPTGSAVEPGGSATGSATEGSGGAVGSGVETAFFDTRERKLGVGLAAGGGIAIIIGVALWASEQSLQDQINTAPNMTAGDISALRSKEDKASAYAWSGNILVVLGLAAGGAGAYYLWTDHKNRSAAATVVPAEQGQGATFVLRGRW